MIKKGNKEMKPLYIVLTILVSVGVHAAEQNLATQTAMVRNKENVQNHKIIREQLKEALEIYDQLKSTLQDALQNNDQQAHDLLKRVLRSQKEMMHIWSAVSDEKGKPAKREITQEDMKEMSDAITGIRAERDAVIEHEKQQEAEVIMGQQEQLHWQGFEEVEPAELLMAQPDFKAPGAGRSERPRPTMQPNRTLSQEEELLEAEWPGLREAIVRSLDEQSDSDIQQGKQEQEQKEESAHAAAVQQGLEWHPLGSVRPLTKMIKEYADLPLSWIDSRYIIQQQRVTAYKNQDYQSVAISSDNQFLVLGLAQNFERGSRAGLIRVINEDGFMQQWTHGLGVEDIAIILEQQCIITGEADNSCIGENGWVDIWSLEGKHRKGFELAGLNHIAVNQAKSFIVAISDKNTWVWDLNGHPQAWSGRGRGGRAVTISKDGQMIIIGQEDGTISINDRAGNRLSSFSSGDSDSSENSWPTNIAISPHNNFVGVIAKNTNYVEIFDMEGDNVADLDGHTDVVTALAIGSNFVVTGSDDTTVRIWDTSTWQEVHKIELGDQITSLAISRDESFVAVTTNHRVFVIWPQQVGSKTSWFKPFVARNDEKRE